MEHSRFMLEALKEAKKAIEYGDVPVGCVIVKDAKIIARGRNEIERKGDPTAHAEIIAIRRATRKLGYQRLLDCTMYVTLEPCNMCAGAIVLARVPRLIFGTSDPKTGACGSLYNIVADERLNHRVEIITGILKNECSQILKTFFADIRKRN